MNRSEATVSLFLSGDVMTGRGIDQILSASVDPILYERSVRDARRYVEIAERRNGPIPRRVPPEYVWGDALPILDAAAPSVRIVNLETAVTDRGSPWPGKGIHYRMHPENIGVLEAAALDCVSLANNHVLDWGYEGLSDTVGALERADVGTVGAGTSGAQSSAPLFVDAGDDCRVIIHGIALPTSGVPSGWAAGAGTTGVNLAGHDTESVVSKLTNRADTAGPPRVDGERNGVSVASIHWGPNWGYEIPAAQREIAHALIDHAGIDVVHGHSSHHFKAIEVYRDRLILYGCGDFITDYEGIGGHEEYRGDISLMYLPTLRQDGSLDRLEIVPLRLRKFRLERVPDSEARWTAAMLSRISEPFGAQAALLPSGPIELSW